MDTESLIGEQIEQLLHGRPGVVWDLVEAPSGAGPNTVTIRDADGTIVAYACPVATGHRWRHRRGELGKATGYVTTRPW
jgi:hypothetical protein